MSQPNTPFSPAEITVPGVAEIIASPFKTKLVCMCATPFPLYAEEQVHSIRDLYESALTALREQLATRDKIQIETNVQVLNQKKELARLNKALATAKSDGFREGVKSARKVILGMIEYHLDAARRWESVGASRADERAAEYNHWLVRRLREDALVPMSNLTPPTDEPTQGGMSDAA